MWAVNPIGIGTVLAPVWNSVPVLRTGVPTNAGILTLGIFPNLQVASLAPDSSRIGDSGRKTAMSAPGDIVFFNCDDENRQDGATDHVGIVEKSGERSCLHCGGQLW